MFKTPLRLLKTTNLEQLAQLPPADQKLIQNIIQRMSIMKVNSLQAQIIQRDLIGMALEQQSRGSSLTAELGSDSANFADEVYKSASSTNWLEIFLSFTLRLSGYFFIWLSASSLLLYGGFTWQVNVNVYPLYAAIIVILFLGELFITPKLIMNQGKLHYLPQVITLTTMFIVTIVFMRLTSHLHPQIINTLPVILLSTVVFLVAQIAQNKLLQKMAAEEKHIIDDLAL